jgi:hypothetical protein
MLIGHSMVNVLTVYAVKNCSMLHRLRLHSANQDIDFLELFRTLEEHGHNITELELKEQKFEASPIQSGQLLAMPTLLGRLTLLTLSGTLDSHFSHDVMQTLGNLCSNLRHLDLDRYLSIYRDDLEILLAGLKDSLVSLKLNWLHDVRRDENQVDHSPFVHSTMLENLSYIHGNGDDIKAIGRLGRLEKLSISESSIQNVSAQDFRDAFQRGNLVNLEVL